jgi:hypothetical protein
MLRTILPFALTLTVSALVSTASAEPAPAKRQLPAPPAEAAKRELDADDEATKRQRASASPYRAKLKPVLAADPRVKPLLAQLAEAEALTDKRARAAKLEGLKAELLAVRADAIKNARLDMPALERDLGDQSPPPAEPKRRPLPPLPTTKVVTVDSFPGTDHTKMDCNDDSDHWDFDGKLVKIRAKSTPADADCFTIRAGRTATLDVPAGMTRVTISARARVELDTFAASLGVWAKATAWWGLRVYSPEGKTLGQFKIGNTTTNIPVAYCKLKSIKATNAGYYPLPFSETTFEEDIQDGDADSECSFHLPSGIKKLEIMMYVGASVDADLTAICHSNNNLKPKSMKVTFSKE